MICACALILEGLLLLATWLSPNMLRHLSAHLMARAAAIDAAKRAHAEALKHWRETFGVGEERATGNIHDLDSWFGPTEAQ